MTEKIPLDGYHQKIQSIDIQKPFFLGALIIGGGILLALTAFCVLSNHGRLRKVQEEVMSLDSVGNLYMLPNFKPYFNKIYYS